MSKTVDASENVIGEDHVTGKGYIGTVWIKFDPEDRKLLERVAERVGGAPLFPAGQPVMVERHFLGRCLICGKDMWGRHVECEQRGKKALEGSEALTDRVSLTAVAYSALTSFSRRALALLQRIDDDHTTACPVCKHPRSPGRSLMRHRGDCELAALLREE